MLIYLSYIDYHLSYIYHVNLFKLFMFIEIYIYVYNNILYL